MKFIKKLRKRIDGLETVLTQLITKADIRHLEHTEQFEIVAMFHIENRILMSDDEYFRRHLDINTITNTPAFEDLLRDMKSTIINKLRELTFSEGILEEIKIYINKPLRIRKQ